MTALNRHTPSMSVALMSPEHPTYSRARLRSDPATFDSGGGSDREEHVRNAAEWVIMICAAILAALFVQAFMFQAFWIPSGSMEPTLMIGDRIVVDKLSYRFGSIDYEDIVVFKRPPATEGDEEVKDLVKRVIALPGDTVEARGGLLYRNGKVIDEHYLPPGTQTIQLPPTVVPKGDLWVMGDNRRGSSDSRVFGAISDDLVEGKAVLRFWPITHLGRV